jgi:hypothetical protein
MISSFEILVHFCFQVASLFQLWIYLGRMVSILGSFYLAWKKPTGLFAHECNSSDKSMLYPS